MKIEYCELKKSYIYMMILTLYEKVNRYVRYQEEETIFLRKISK